MPPLETMDRYQKATVWPNTGIGNYGKPIVGAAQSLGLVRWTNENKEGVNELGETIQIAATVVIDPTIPIPPIGSILALGYPPPSTPTGLMRLSGYKHGRDIRDRSKRTVLTLERWMGSLPLAATA